MKHFKEDVIEYYTEVFLCFAVRVWAKSHKRTLDMRTYTHANGNKYFIRVCREDYSRRGDA